MAKFADVAYKSVTAGLGLATLWVGGNLVLNITRGISWHYAQEKVHLAVHSAIVDVVCGTFISHGLLYLTLFFHVRSTLWTNAAVAAPAATLLLLVILIDFWWFFLMYMFVGGQPTGEAEASQKTWTRIEDEMPQISSLSCSTVALWHSGDRRRPCTALAERTSWCLFFWGWYSFSLKLSNWFGRQVLLVR